MKNAFTILGTLCLSQAVFAGTMTCTVDVLRADKAGVLLPLTKPLSVKTQVMLAKTINMAECGVLKHKDLDLRLCAKEAEFVGGYEVALIDTNKMIDDSQVLSVRTLGTLKEKSGLIEIHAQDEVLNSFSLKTQRAGIETPSTFSGDSALLDDAVKQGLEKGVLAGDEIAVVTIDDCQLTK